MNNFVKVIVFQVDQESKKDRSLIYTDITDICKSITHTSFKNTENGKDKEYKINLELDNTFYTNDEYECIFTKNFEMKITYNSDAYDSEMRIVLIESFKNKVKFSIFDSSIISKIETLPVKQVFKGVHNVGDENNKVITSSFESEGVKIELISKEKTSEIISYEEFLNHLKFSNKLSKTTDLLIETAFDLINESYKEPISNEKEDFTIVFQPIRMTYMGREDTLFKEPLYSSSRNYSVEYHIRSSEALGDYYEINLDECENGQKYLENIKKLKKEFVKSHLINFDKEGSEIERILYDLFRNAGGEDLQQFFLKQIPEEDDSNE